MERKWRVKESMEEKEKTGMLTDVRNEEGSKEVREQMERT